MEKWQQLGYESFSAWRHAYDRKRRKKLAATKKLNADRAVVAVVFSSSFSFDAAQSINIVAVITAAVTTACTIFGDPVASGRDAA